MLQDESENLSEFRAHWFDTKLKLQPFCLTSVDSVLILRPKLEFEERTC